MKKIILSLFLLFIVGCGVNQKFVKAVEKNWAVIRPEYVEYVTEDDSLTTEEKDVKIFTVRLFDEMIERAKKE